MKQVINKQPNSTECFVCGTRNDKGLGARFFETDTDEIAALFTPHKLHQGYPGRLHGGIAACMLDETMGRAIQIGNPDIWGVTVELSLTYRKPLPYCVQLKVLGRVTKQNRLMFEGEGEIYTPEGEVAVTAKAKYVKMTISNISAEFSEECWKVRSDTDDPVQIDL